jgi:maltose O-acetyltransferase
MQSQKAKMLAGELYSPNDPEIQADQLQCHRWLQRYNERLDLPADERGVLLTEQFAQVGKGVVIRPPFYCDYGYNISIEDDVFVNFNCTILDVVSVSIGAKTQIGPNVQIYTADHPRDPASRSAGLEFGRPVQIGGNVWIGGAAIILPGLSIGDNAIVGAGSVVTRNVPAGATVAGNPARIVGASRE